MTDATAQDWQDDAKQLFGRDWQAPLADVAGAATGAKPESMLRSVQRWRERGRCPPSAAAWLAKHAEKGPTYGAVLRQALRRSPDRSAAIAALRTAADDIEAGRLP